MKAVFRVDAGQILHVAMGHAFRCLALAEELKKDGVDSVFVMAAEPSGNRFFTDRGFEVHKLTETQDEVAVIDNLKPDVVIFDLLRASIESTETLMNRAYPVLVLDDLGIENLAADVIINGSLNAQEALYPNRQGELHLGADFMVLAEEFTEKPTHSVATNVDQILVTLGGADPRGFTPIVVNSLVEKGIGKDIVVVKGPAYGDRSIGKIPAFGMKTQVRVQENVPDLSMLMMAADLVIAAGGRTAFELAATGTPSVLVPTAEHEVKTARSMEREGTALAVSEASEEGVLRELPGLVQKAKSPEVRRSMAESGRRLVDGKGRKRVAQLIHKLGTRRAETGWGID